MNVHYLYLYDYSVGTEHTGICMNSYEIMLYHPMVL